MDSLLSEKHPKKTTPTPSQELMTVAQRVCRAEFHIECMETSGRGFREFLGRSVEEFVDHVAESIGIEIWYTTLPKSGQFSKHLAQLRNDRNDRRECDVASDTVERFVTRAHHHNILVVACFNMNAFLALGKVKPQWLIQDLPDGRDIKKNEYFFCHNSGYGDWLLAYLKDQVQQFSLDGVWFDDTQYGSRGAWPWPAGCLCKDCTRLYRQETGRDIPTQIDWDDDAFKQWVNWRYDNLRNFQKRITEEVRSIRSEAVVRFNSYPRANLNWSTANDLNAADPAVGYFIETDYRRMGPTMTAKIARARGDCEIWGFVPQFAGPGGELGLGTAPYQDPDLCSRFYFAGFANGVHVQGISDYQHPEIVPAIPFGALKQRRPYFGGKSIRQCAVHVSRQTRDFHYSTDLTAVRDMQERLGQAMDDMGGTDNYWKQLRGIHEMLEQTHVIHDLLFDDSITRAGLDGYRILILPNSACLSDDQCEAIRTWVAQGGTVIATFETSLCDELGRTRDDFKLADVFGIHWFGTNSDDHTAGTVYVPQGKLTQLVGDIIGFAGRHTEIRSADNGNLDVLYTLSTHRRLRPFNPSNHTHDSGHLGVTHHRYGQGQAIYISGDIGNGFCDHPLPCIRSMFEDLVCRGELHCEIDGPSDLFATAFEQAPDRWLVHLYQQFVPFTPWTRSHPETPQWAALTKIRPAHNVTLKFNTFDIIKATLPLSNDTLVVENNTVTIPEVLDHIIVEIEIKTDE